MRIQFRFFFAFWVAFQAIPAQQLPWKQIPSGELRQAPPLGQKAGQRFFNLSTLQAGVLRFWSLGQNPIPGDSSLSFATAAFDTLHDGLQGYNPPKEGALELDSVGWLLLHRNVSGLVNRLLCEVILLDTSGFPTQTQLFADSLSSNQSFTGAQPQRIWFKLPLRIGPDTAFGLRLRFLEFGEGDSLWLGNLHPIKDTCQSLVQATNSNFYPQSFGYWKGYNLELPSPNGGDFYTDCNSNGVFDSLIDGQSPIQLWDVELSLRASYFTGLESWHKALNVQIFPNPCRNWLHWNGGDYAATLLNWWGQALRQSNGQSLNLEGLQPGSYLLHLTDGKRHHRQVIVKL